MTFLLLLLAIPLDCCLTVIAFKLPRHVFLSGTITTSISRPGIGLSQIVNGFHQDYSACQLDTHYQKSLFCTATVPAKMREQNKSRRRFASATRAINGDQYYRIII
ncbi:hypothetical protein DFH08DRAFT_820837 [Mycena albidolilacea]|uniref:Secreted protein n=1 Tax=Mycena albidolilacea TaxID=1033008 RepID=A0AAD6ZC89_9AGAR|nr:hypothetical protein DFH08DRAFT_820837 [Mycena albidolilacea]